MKNSNITLLLTFLLCVSFCHSYILKSYVIDGGGVAKASSSGYIIGCSVSQSFAAKVSAGNYIAYIGYWTPRIAPPGIEETNRFNLVQPVVFSLSPNYPNPVSHRTTIKYSIANTCNVELKLFDVTGRQVAVLVNENQKPGYYQINWDIRNVSEAQLPNGVYFYRLTAGDYTETRKMVVVR